MTPTTPHSETNLSNTTFWGIDIGGAHLKLATADGDAASMPFPMWTDWSQMGEAILQLRDSLGVQWNEYSRLAVTMTGEMADCFESRRVGVASILQALTDVIPSHQCCIYAIGGRWLSVEQARCDPWSVAASNWHALAQWCLQQSHWGAADWSAVVDIGSTTVDIIPVFEQKIVSQATTDRQRLQLSQLVYTGMERTPVHAIVRRLWIDGRPCPVMAEKFATISDANLVLGAAEEEPDNRDSADGRPRTRRCAMARLARMVGEDIETLSEDLLIEIARQIVDIQAAQVRRSLLLNLSSQTETRGGRRVFVTGHGRALIERICSYRRMSNVQFDYLDHHVSSAASRCAPALATAWLYREHCREALPDKSRTVDEPREVAGWTNQSPEPFR